MQSVEMVYLLSSLQVIKEELKAFIHERMEEQKALYPLEPLDYTLEEEQSGYVILDSDALIHFLCVMSIWCRKVFLLLQSFSCSFFEFRDYGNNRKGCRAYSINT